MIHLLAPAKLTWFLEVTGVRDNGLHELRSEMVTLALADRVVIEPDADYLRFTPPDPTVALDDTNLVARALALLGRRAGVSVTKAIPVGGGLGGGSADAGAILRWGGGVSATDALQLGGDVPFCQLGGRALVEGVGERLTPLRFESRDVTLLMPDFAVSTASCYRAFDHLAMNGDVARGRNHLEVAAGIVEPRLASTLGWLRSELGDEVTLCGSGSTMFIEGHVEKGLERWDVQGPDGTVRFCQTTTTPS